MTRERYYLGAYWGARAETRRQIAERLAATMLELRAIHALLAQWNQGADTFEDALRLVVEPTPEALEPLLTTIEPGAPTRFGYDLSLWNGRERDAEQCMLRVDSGMVPEHSGGPTNHIVLDLPRDTDIEPALHSPDVLTRLLQVVARIWRPDHARIISPEYDDLYARPDGQLPTPGKPVVGWMTYLRAERLTRLPERIPCKTVDVDGLGTIFVVTDDHRFTVDNPDDVARALALTEFLEQHGALDTIPTNLPM